MTLMSMVLTATFFFFVPTTPVVDPLPGMAEVVVGVVATEDLAGLHCERCYNHGSNHHFHGQSCGSDKGDSQCFNCHTWNSCHPNDQPGRCDQWHWACHRDQQAAVENALDASDLPALRALLVESDGKVTLNVSRSAIQVSGCGGHVASHYVISDPWMAALTGPEEL